jgi:hypothetical protein
MRKSSLKINAVSIVLFLIIAGTIITPVILAKPTKNLVEYNVNICGSFEKQSHNLVKAIAYHFTGNSAMSPIPHNVKNCYNPAWTGVYSCFGLAIDVWPIYSENKTVGYWFYASNVICKINGNFHHFHNGEVLAINKPYMGIFHEIQELPDFTSLWFICARSI